MNDEKKKKKLFYLFITPYYPINVPKELNRPERPVQNTESSQAKNASTPLFVPALQEQIVYGKVAASSFAGHNKWSKIKRKKAVNDAARNKVYTKLLNQIAHALRQVDGDQSNAKFVQALQNAKSQGVPKSNIENAIKRGMGVQRSSV